jgi:hypothetical protein
MLIVAGAIVCIAAHALLPAAAVLAVALPTLAIILWLNFRLLKVGIKSGLTR